MALVVMAELPGQLMGITHDAIHQCAVHPRDCWPEVLELAVWINRTALGDWDRRSTAVSDGSACAVNIDAFPPIIPLPCRYISSLWFAQHFFSSCWSQPGLI